MLARLLLRDRIEAAPGLRRCPSPGPARRLRSIATGRGRGFALRARAAARSYASTWASERRPALSARDASAMAISKGPVARVRARRLQREGHARPATAPVARAQPLRAQRHPRMRTERWPCARIVDGLGFMSVRLTSRCVTALRRWGAVAWMRRPMSRAAEETACAGACTSMFTMLVSTPCTSTRAPSVRASPSASARALGVVVREPRPVVRERVERARGEDPDLPHPTAPALPEAARLLHERARRAEGASHGSAQPLREADAHGVEG